MTNPAMPSLPGFGAIAETMEWVGKMWGGGANAPGIGLPGMVMPTLSVEEINKQISDLKAVESWLTLNMNMLRGTIQALEVQSATISTLRSMGETLNASVKAATPAAPTPTPAPAPAPAASASSGFSYPFGRAAEPSPKAAEPPSPPPPPIQAAPQPVPAPEPSAASGEAAPDAAARKTAAAGPSAENPFVAPLANPATWWNLLQDQFKQAVSNAMTPDATAARARPAAKKESPDAGSAGRTGAKRTPAAGKTGGAAKKAAAGAASRTAGKTATKTATKSAAKTAAKPGSRQR